MIRRLREVVEAGVGKVRRITGGGGIVVRINI
jgi:hypothetical protein